MTKEKISKIDKKWLSITIIVGFIAQFFIDSGMDIALLCFCMYIFHKYMATTDNIKEYESYEFSDKGKFDKGRKLFVRLVDAYIVIKIIFMILNPQSSYAFSENMLIVMIYIPYEKYLEKKYVIKTNIAKEKKKVVFVRRKILTSVLVGIFAIFSIVTFTSLKKLDIENYVKYVGNEYKVSRFDDKRKIEIEVGGHYMMAEESEGNSKYFDTFLDKGKALMKKQTFKSYMFISMLIMVVVCFSEIYPKDKKIESIISNMCLVSLLLCSIFYFNFDIWNDEMELSSYFHEYMNR